MLSLDPAVREAFLGPDDTDGDPFEVVVYDNKPRGGALERAEALLVRRLRGLALAGVEPGRWVAADRVDRHRGIAGISGRHGLVELHTTTDLGRLDAGPRNQPGAREWLTVLRDDTGELDSRRRHVVAVLDPSTGAARLVPITGTPFPPRDPADPGSPPAPPVRLEMRDAAASVLVVPRAADMEVRITARVRLRAIGGPTQWFELHVPRAGHRAQFWVDGVTRTDGHDVLASTPLRDADPVLGRGDLSAEPRRRLSGVASRRRPEERITVALPEPLEAGDTVTLDVTWRDIWPWLNALYTEADAISLGEGSGRQQFLPRLAVSGPGNPVRYRAKVAVPLRSKVRIAASGTEWGRREDRDFMVWDVSQNAIPVPWAEIAAARFAEYDLPAEGDLPAVRTRTLRASYGPGLAADVRKIISVYHRFLPSYPWHEHEIFQAPGRLDDLEWASSHELTQFMEALTMDTLGDGANTRHLVQRLLAREVAQQWFGQLVRPAHSSDAWLTDALSEQAACLYIQAAFGACDARMEQARETWERWEGLSIPRAAPLSASWSSEREPILADYGPYVLHEMLRERVGRRAYHRALRGLVAEEAGHAVTTERLLGAFQAATEDDLGDFFDFWLYGGFIPEELNLTWHWGDGELTAAVHSDVPFGRMDVPVHIDGEEHRVVVEHGRGELRLHMLAEPASVLLDPEGRTLAGRRVVKREASGPKASGPEASGPEASGPEASGPEASGTEGGQLGRREASWAGGRPVGPEGGQLGRREASWAGGRPVGPDGGQRAGGQLGRREASWAGGQRRPVGPEGGQLGRRPGAGGQLGRREASWAGGQRAVG